VRTLDELTTKAAHEPPALTDRRPDEWRPSTDLLGLAAHRYRRGLKRIHDERGLTAAETIWAPTCPRRRVDDVPNGWAGPGRVCGLPGRTEATDGPATYYLARVRSVRIAFLSASTNSNCCFASVTALVATVRRWSRTSKSLADKPSWSAGAANA
jgi:hypothetical protein